MKEGIPFANTIINIGNSDKLLTFIERILCKIKCSAQFFINYIKDNFKKVVSVEKQTQQTPGILLETASQLPKKEPVTTATNEILETQQTPRVLLHTADESSEEVKKSATIVTDKKSETQKTPRVLIHTADESSEKVKKI